MTTANVSGMRVVPAAVADTPTTLTMKIDKKKTAAKNDAPTSVEAALTTAKVRLRKRSSAITGEGTRDSTTSSSAVATAATSSRPTTAGDDHGYCSLSSVRASSSGTTEAISRAVPAQSTVAGRPLCSLGIFATMNATATMPTGTFT